MKKIELAHIEEKLILKGHSEASSLARSLLLQKGETPFIWEKLFRLFTRYGANKHLVKLLDFRGLPSQRELKKLVVRKKLNILAAVISLQGAWKFAEKILAITPARNIFDFEINANVYFLNGDFEKAMEIYGRILKLQKPESYSKYHHALSNFIITSLHAGKLNESREKLAIFKKYAKTSPQLSYFYYNLMGLYHFKKKSYERANAWFLKSSNIRSPIRKRPFPGSRFHLVFWCACLCRLGDNRGAKRLFNHYKLQFQGDYKAGLSRAETYLFNLSFINEPKVTGKEHLLLFSYPEIPMAYQAVSKDELAAAALPNIVASKVFYLYTGEIKENGKFRLDDSKESYLLSMVLATGNLGIKVERLYELLWPDEVFSYSQLPDRLRKIISRIKSKFSIDITINKQIVLIKDPKDFCANILKSELSIVSKLALFDSQSFADYYNTSLSKAQKKLKQLCLEGKLQKRGTGRATRYQSVVVTHK
ncbi:MAG: hypothetical protein HOE90_03650 [Bacteriovoracaceae bacterium]|jgi:tetratricopeptide (TPR) repeat protein|nr:hypothetical protein [Bacteriovoracaceae bacterium]